MEMDKSKLERTIEDTIMTVVTARGTEKTCCPSEVARKIEPKNWRPHMELIRCIAKQMMKEGKIEICQGGKVVESFDIKGPIRLRLKKPISPKPTAKVFCELSPRIGRKRKRGRSPENGPQHKT